MSFYETAHLIGHRSRSPQYPTPHYTFVKLQPRKASLITLTLHSTTINLNS